MMEFDFLNDKWRYGFEGSAFWLASDYNRLPSHCGEAYSMGSLRPHIITLV